MSDARARILDAVRGALGSASSDDSRRAAVTARIEAHKANLVPARARGTDTQLADLLISHLQGQGADLLRLETPEAVPAAVAAYLRQHNLPASLRTGDDPVIDAMPWADTPSLERRRGRAEGDDAVTLSRAVTAAAETGTLFLTSGADNPTTLNFLPDTHVIVLATRDIKGSYEDAFTALRAIHGARTLPRTLNLISGPSRTADIAQTIIMGAHGPRRLLVLLID